VHASPMMFHALTKTHHSLMLEKMKEGILCDAKRKIMQFATFYYYFGQWQIHD